jgi:hypothetical protein
MSKVPCVSCLLGLLGLNLQSPPQATNTVYGSYAEEKRQILGTYSKKQDFALMTTASFGPFIILCPFQVTMAVLY